MATGHNRLSVVEELSSPALGKLAATVSVRWGYLELPELSDNPLPSYNTTTASSNSGSGSDSSSSSSGISITVSSSQCFFSGGTQGYAYP
jgi:hypothetical protein